LLCLADEIATVAWRCRRDCPKWAPALMQGS
jgi:hypothetical protein